MGRLKLTYFSQFCSIWKRKKHNNYYGNLLYFHMNSIIHRAKFITIIGTHTVGFLHIILYLNLSDFDSFVKLLAPCIFPHASNTLPINLVNNHVTMRSLVGKIPLSLLAPIGLLSSVVDITFITSRIRILILMWCGCRSNFSFRCGFGCGTCFFVWIRIRLVTLMRIRIQVPKMIRIHNTASKPKACWEHSESEQRVFLIYF